MYEQLQRWAADRGQAVALWQWRGNQPALGVTWRELAEMARWFASMFGEDRESRDVPLFLGKTPACVAAMAGAIGAGKAFACLNRKLRAPQVEQILAVLQARRIYLDGPGVMGLASGVAAGSVLAGVEWNILEDSSFLPAHQAALGRLTGIVKSRRRDRQNVAPSPGDQHDVLRTSAKQVGCCLFTSGSTGTPKGVLIAESDLRARAAAEVAWFSLTSDDVLLSILPFSFDVGLNQLLGAMAAGCSMVLLDSWLPVDILRASADRKVTGICSVPSIWLDMLNAGMQFDTTEKHRSLRYITLSGGDLPKPFLDRLPSIAPGVGIYKTYGQSEDFRSTSLLPHEYAEHKQSVGRAFIGTRVYVVREDLSPCKPSEEGEIVHTGLGVMLGYADRADPQNKLRPNPFRGEFDHSEMAVFTGDRGYFDAEGYLHLRGRADTMLKVAGNRVYPKEIVDQLLHVTGLQDAEVVGIKAEDGETQLFAFVVAPAGNAMQIKRDLAARVPSYMVPREIVILPAMPRTANGKCDRPVLIERAEMLLKAETLKAETRQCP